jgi:hypothetical protein
VDHQMQNEKWESNAPLHETDRSFNRFVLINISIEFLLFIYAIFFSFMSGPTNFSMIFCSSVIFFQLCFIVVRFIKVIKEKIIHGKTNRRFILVLYCIMLFPAWLLLIIILGLANIDLDFGIGMG